MILLFREGRLTHLVLTAQCDFIDRVTAELGLPSLARETALFEWTGIGWRKVRSWPLPAQGFP
jgi:hypothetical protein